jgi:fumarate hydratase class II
MPREIVHAFAYLKKAAALTNLELGKLAEGEERPHRQGVRRDPHRCVGRSVPLGDLADRQRHAEQHERERGGGLPRARPERRQLTDEQKVLNPNDDVNKSQSSNDTYPDGDAHRGVQAHRGSDLPGVKKLRDTLDKKSEGFQGHREDRPHALHGCHPAHLGQEFSGYVQQLDNGMRAVNNALEMVRELALGGTAVGTGLNAPKATACWWRRRSPS